MEPMEQIRVGLLPKQREFVDESESRYKLYSGSRAAGKSLGLCLEVWMKARHKGVRVGLYRMNYSDLVKTTLVTLLEGDDLPPVLPEGSYAHNQQKHRIDLYGGGSIFYGGFDKGISAKEMGGTGSKSSINLTAAAIDEAVEVPESLLVQLDGGVRMKHPIIKNQISMACNPGPPTHYLARRFGLSLDHKLEPNHFVVKTNIYDNFKLGKDYVDAFAKTLSGVAYKRYIWGLWVGSDGAIYDTFNRDIHVCERDFEPVRTVYGVDPGTNDPYVMLRCDFDGDNNAHISREYYQTKHTPSEQVELLGEFVEGSDDDCVIDNAYPGLIEDMRRSGINAMPCKKGPDSIIRGIGCVAARLNPANVRLTIDPGCVKTIAEFETYEWAKTPGGLKDKPADSNNHAMDALRYLLERVDGYGGGFMVVPDSSTKADDTEPKTMDEMRDANPDWGWD